MPAPQPPPAKAEAATSKDEPAFLSVAEVAARWKLHPATIRKMVRQERLPRLLIGRHSLIPMSAIAQCEKQGWVADEK